MNVKDYVKDLNRELATGLTREHAFRPALKYLIESSSQSIIAVNEPKRIDCGAPDFIVQDSNRPVGYVEAKDIDTPLGKAAKSDQLKRYRQALANLVLTDYVEFQWFVNGELRLSARLGEVNNNKLVASKDGVEQVESLLAAFLQFKSPSITRSEDLATRMAALAKLIKTSILSSMALEDPKQGPLHQQLQGFRDILIRDLTLENFSDMYAQTICYGLFAAKVNAKVGESFTRQNAAFILPRTNPFLQNLFMHIAGPNLDDSIVWAVDDLVDLLNTIDIGVSLAGFGQRTKQEDPVLHFYETFLNAYDKKTKVESGVFYTPDPVVSYIINSVDYVLKSSFSIKDGLSDTEKIEFKDPATKARELIHRVLILDPAAGTGTFLHEVINHISLRFSKNRGILDSYVAEHLLPRIYGFELQMAPYAVAHMKLGLQLKDLGYKFQTNERLKVYLTNTLDEALYVGGLPLFTQWLGQEAAAASAVKQNYPVMVILGNPPYSVKSKNKGKWIEDLLLDYKKDLGEKKTNLDDDYIKFIRFAQWRIDKTGQGVVAFITNNSFLDGITHRRMRESLMETFDDIYVLDLHGNKNKKEMTPSGDKDDNVFDIQQGVAISIFVKRPGKRKSCTVYHAELWGRRIEKYDWLQSHSLESTRWTELKDVNKNSCLGKFYFFRPQTLSNIDEYCDGYGLKQIFISSNNGIKTDRDGLFYDYSKHDLELRMKQFFSDEGIVEPFKSNYNVNDSSGYKLLDKRRASKFDISNIRQCLYRPYDRRWLYYSPEITSRHAWPVMQHMLTGENTGIITTRQTSEKWAVFSTNILCGHKSCAGYDINSLFPLYIYPDKEDVSLFDILEPKKKDRKPNFREDFVEQFAAQLGLTWIENGDGDRHQTFGPYDVFAYMYAVFNSSLYERRYAEFLKVDYARLPFIEDAQLFWELRDKGATLLHLQQRVESDAPLLTIPSQGDRIIREYRFELDKTTLSGRVWISSGQFISGISQGVWDYIVGGYQVCLSWLRDREGRALSFDDLREFSDIVHGIERSLETKAEIDDVIARHGGFPLKDSLRSRKKK